MLTGPTRDADMHPREREKEDNCVLQGLPEQPAQPCGRETPRPNALHMFAGPTCGADMCKGETRTQLIAKGFKETPSRMLTGPTCDADTRERGEEMTKRQGLPEQPAQPCGRERRLVRKSAFGRAAPLILHAELNENEGAGVSWSTGG